MKEVTNEFEALNFLQDLKHEIERRLGSLRAAQGAKTITLPLDSVEIDTRIVGRVAEVTLTQVFKNPYSEHLEAEYIFPLAGCSTVNGFKMHAGGRTVIGTIQERRAAREEYQRALTEGKRASLLEQERDDVFTMQVGNIPPREKITVELTYTEKLEFYEDGTTELRLPLVVAPRYVPGTPVVREQVGDGVLEDTDQVPDASRISPPRLADGVNPDVSLSITVELIPESLPGRDGHGFRVSDLSCSQHAVQTRTDGGVIRVTLAKANELLNRDFVLKWRMVGESMTSSVVLYDEAGAEGETRKQGYAMLSLVPPASVGVKTAARDVVFVLDRSGSMGGNKMVSAARACAILLSTLGPKDRFAINAFDDRCEWYNSSAHSSSNPWLSSTTVNEPGLFCDADMPGIESGIDFLKRVEARGGTELGQALQESLKLIASDRTKGRVPVIVVLTDGEVSNESAIFKLVQTTARDTRIFTIGIDTAVNSPLLKRIAALAGGTSTFVVPGTQLEDALVQIGREIGTPLLTDLQVECITSGVKVESMAPGRMPDLFSGRTADCLFRVSYDAKVKGTPKFRIKGKLPNGRKHTEEVTAQLVNLEAVPRLWAREYIKELEDELRVNAGRTNIKQEIIDLSLKFSILTRFTAFVAVDHAEVVNNTGEVRQVVQPVHMPDQWEMQQQGAYYNSSLGQSYGYAAPPASPGAAGGGIASGFFDQADQTVSWGAPQQQSSGYGSVKRRSLGSAGAASNQWKSADAPQGGLFGMAASGGADDTTPLTLAESIRQKISESQRLSREGSSMPPAQPSSMPAPSAPVPPVPPADKAKRLTLSSWSQQIQPRGKQDDTDEQVPEPIISAAWSTMKKLFTGGDAKPIQSISGGVPVARVLNALKNFHEVWMASWMEIGKGMVPDADLVERARKELIDAFADHPIGFEVPLMQKFLRASAIEYVSALQEPDVTAWALYKSRARFHNGFVDAMVEAENAALQLQGRQGAFWESNV